MHCWRIASRLGSPCKIHLEEISRRPVTISTGGLSIKRNLCKSLQSSSSTIEETYPSTVNDNEQSLERTTNQDPVSSLPSHKQSQEADEVDEDASIKAKIIFNTHLYKVDPEQIWIRKKLLQIKMAKQVVRDIEDHGYPSVKSVSMKYLGDNLRETENQAKSEKKILLEPTQEEDVHFPFASHEKPSAVESKPQGPKRFLPRRIRIEMLVAQNSDKILREKIQNVIEQRWMSDYEHFKEGALESWQKMYGTPQKEIPVSKIPCGGCGAYFQCQEPAIPGYLPSEIFLDLCTNEFKTIICQRCHFLRNYEIALDVQVPAAEYPVVLDDLSRRNGLIVLIIDLLDFPCSIWPGLSKIIGERKPVIVVGNKVDLLPGDHRGYLSHLRNALKSSLVNYGLNKIKLKNIRLVSARTGFGVEELITELQTMSDYKGDVFLLGCTNVGKSTLFNCLLQSDLCKVQAVDLVQRATTSQWPNTTLNLLKFPMMRPAGWKLEQRMQRLQTEDNSRHMEKRLRAIQLNKKHIYHMPSFLEFVGRTFKSSEYSQQNRKDVFNARTHPDSKKKLGLDEEDPLFKNSRWCYDTPGVCHPDQILTLLTTEELLEVLPSSSLVPRTFRLRFGQSLFVAGLARVDFLDGEENDILVTLFASDKLPVTVVWTNDADLVYNYALGTEILKVPHSGVGRLSRWPGLKAAARPYTVYSDTVDKSGADLVLSSTGWISVTTEPLKKVTLLPWTPEARGMHFRIPALIPYAVKYRGKRIPRSPMYGTKRASPRETSLMFPEERDN